MATVRYLVGNHRPHAMEILEKIGIPKEKTVPFSRYQPKEGEVPILISTHGYFHGDSLRLSDRMREAGIPLNYKVNIDAHSDFGARGGVPWGELKEIGLGKNPLTLARLARETKSYASHMREAYEQGWAEGMAFLGVKGEYQQGGHLRHHFKSAKKAFDPNLIMSEDVGDVGMVNEDGRRYDMHLTIDTDTLHEAGFIEMAWRNNNSFAPTLRELCDAAERLIASNDVRCIDICGFSPGLEGGEAGYNEGMMAYARILGTVEEALHRS